jgi:sugar-specific transcriptional regulator TrmB
VNALPATRLINPSPEAQLEQFGLSPAEAQIYLVLLRNGALRASAIANIANIPRTSVYPALNALVNKGLAEGGAGYGSRFCAVPAKEAVSALVCREKDELSQRECLAKELTQQLSSLVEPVGTLADDPIQIIKNPHVVAERFHRLQLEAERQIEVFIKPPFFPRPLHRSLGTGLRHGVRARTLHERTAVDVAATNSYPKSWLSREEEARVYDGELPHKLAIFDRQCVLVYLTLRGEQIRTVFSRHPELANSLGMLFDSLWERAKPLSTVVKKRLPSSSLTQVSTATNGNALRTNKVDSNR